MIKASETTYSGYYFKNKSCGLHTEGHRVQNQHIDVLNRVRDNLDAERFAAGCSGCAHTDDDKASVWWVAQGQSSDVMLVKYDSGEDLDRTDVAEAILTAANEEDVEADWSGDSDECVVLGDADYYSE